MRQRTEVAIALAVSAALIVLSFASGTRARGSDDVDRRASTFNAGREGGRALADVATRLGTEVVRWRVRPQRYASWIAALPADSARPTTIAVLDPIGSITREEREAYLPLTTARRGAQLVFAGRRVAEVYDCLGYHVESSRLDSSRVARQGRGPEANAPFVHDYFARGSRKESADHGDAGDDDDGDAIDGKAHPCPPLSISATDTLLTDAKGAPVMVRLTVAPHGRTIVIVSDGALVRNRTLRTGATRAEIVDAIVPAQGRLIFDEYQQGYVEGGSMPGAVLAWSRHNPVGWMVWQWCALALIALLAGAFRFGPVRAAIPRQRRSSLEHVRALATALAAARGHRTAVRAMVRGLQRRLAPGRGTSSTPRDDWRAYLASLRTHGPNPQVQASAAQLERLADHPESDTAVLNAANAVEDLWHSLRP